jgi:hypothetical protein
MMAEFSSCFGYVCPNVDLHLLPNAPAIDNGSADLAPALDLERIPRPQGRAVDQGAYEWHEASVTPGDGGPPPGTGGAAGSTGGSAGSAGRMSGRGGNGGSAGSAGRAASPADSGSDGGCACGVPGARGSASLLGLLLCAGAAGLARRRR